MMPSLLRAVDKCNFIVAAVVGIVHALFAGYLFHPVSGGGENFIIIVIMDFPIYVLGEILFPHLLSSSAIFVVVYFVGLGSIMYALAGFFCARFFRRGK